ncbi:ATM interactor [Operophtera brumata]|uniref:ATM interactor n=1 Tax=Operophtera brumata TaxID=104452 RepID=A0A0L7KTX4_OPEBR|nr:ATM interactor [Operophtera brumata]
MPYENDCSGKAVCSSVDDNNIVFKFNEKELIFTIEAPDQDMNLNFPCPYNCIETYSKKNDILNHLIRAHNHKKDYEIGYHYHCWEKECIYNKNSVKGKFFNERKYLNQHYNKVHKSKIFYCDKCESHFSTTSEFNRHRNTCNTVFLCEHCNKEYKIRDRLLVHLKRRHPDKHREYKTAKKAEKRKAMSETVTKKPKMASLESLFETDSPKRSFATQTLNLKDSIKNDVTLSPWQSSNNEISTQTGFEDLLSLKSNSEDDSLFYSETTLSDIQTQTFPLEFGLVVNRSHKETLTESLDMSMKGTQTCICYFDSPKMPFGDKSALDSVSSSPRSGNLTSTETQTADYKSSVPSDVLLSLNSTETQTCFEEALKESL